MLGWIMVFASVSLMVKVATIERRSPVFWGGLTFVLCLGGIFGLPSLPLINIGIGVGVSFLAMFILKMFGKGAGV
ncbi:MAG: hypothetical protein GY869_00220 [Planctomycetes bacterium]|nr:hypothetical protein [Planctomycetota bacterium]